MISFKESISMKGEMILSYFLGKKVQKINFQFKISSEQKKTGKYKIIYIFIHNVTEYLWNVLRQCPFNNSNMFIKDKT